MPPVFLYAAKGTDRGFTKVIVAYYFGNSST